MFISLFDIILKNTRGIMKLIIISLSLVSCLFSYNKEYSFRKYSHIKTFYEPLLKQTIDIALKNNIPPAAILAIASVESGYGRGYVASITGNILSLGAYKSDKELPSLYLPNIRKPYTVIYNEKQIKKYAKKELVWKQRPKSLKKDYRPIMIAGTTEELDYFDYNAKAKQKANLKNIQDFCTLWISEKNSHKVFKEAKKYLNKQVKKYGKKVLFSKELNEKFIQSIGGKKNSFNFRKSWGKKVISVLKKTGLVQLTSDVYHQKSFKKVW